MKHQQWLQQEEEDDDGEDEESEEEEDSPPPVKKLPTQTKQAVKAPMTPVKSTEEYEIRVPGLDDDSVAGSDKKGKKKGDKKQLSPEDESSSGETREMDNEKEKAKASVEQTPEKPSKLSFFKWASKWKDTQDSSDE